jgi:hypothetical protein
VSKPKINCGICDKPFSSFSRECPICGWLNPDFFKLPSGKREQIHIDVWIDREVYVALDKLRISDQATQNQIIGLAVEEFITRRNRKAEA